MASPNVGVSVGRLSIRVLPDTRGFRRDLERRLAQIAKTTKMTVGVDRAVVNGQRIREDIRRQLENLKGVAIDANVKTNVDRDFLRKQLEGAIEVVPSMDSRTIKRLRDEMNKALGNIEMDLKPTLDDRRLRQRLDVLRNAFNDVSGRLAHDILSPSDAEALRHRLNQIKEHIDDVAKNREARLDVNPFTAWATARLAWLTRPRTVEIVAKVSKASVAAALTTLSALSGARLSWKWIDDLATKLKNLDKNLPAITGMTTGITSLIASIFAAGSGLVGLGQGLFSITPALLVIPGLILNAVGSVTALIVALRNAGTELEPLKDDMSELGDIINEAFWGNARQPILDLVDGLMPQLRTSFHDLSTGIGEFTAALSQAFGEELANGRLASIFNGIAEGWRVLGTGASGFAGALVSLSQIAATYTPRLAGWFVRQANTFDAWLEAIATDGRLSSWMEGAISSMYDLWDVTRGVSGVLTGIWRAADSAGSAGLAGFADMMLEWKEVVNGADFQRGLSAVFRGSYTAMSAFGEAIKSIGRLVADLDVAFETFIGSAGTFFGGLIGGAADALNQDSVNTGLMDLSAGLVRALEGILPHLPTIASTFGDFLGLLGDLAGELLPTAATVLAELMPTVSTLIDAIRPALPGLADAVTTFAEAVGPAIAEFAEAAGPILTDALSALADAMVELSPVIAELIGAIADFFAAVDVFAEGAGDFFDDVRIKLGLQVEEDEAIGQLQNIVEGHDIDYDPIIDVRFKWRWNADDPVKAASDNARLFVEEYERVLAEEGQDAADALMEAFNSIDGMPQSVIDKVNGSLEAIRVTSIADSGDITTAVQEAVNMISAEFEANGAGAAAAMWNSVTGELPAEVRQSVLAQLDALGIDISSRGGGAGGGFSWNMSQGIIGGLPDVESSALSILEAASAAVADAPARGRSFGSSMGSEFAGGVGAGSGPSASAATLVKNAAVEGFKGGNTYGIGLNLASGMRSGILAGVQGVIDAAVYLVNSAVSAAEAAGEIHSPSRLMAREIGAPLAQGVAVGIERNASGIRTAMTRAVDLSDVSGRAPELRGETRPVGSTVNLNIHNPVARDIQTEAWEAAQLAGVLA